MQCSIYVTSCSKSMFYIGIYVVGQLFPSIAGNATEVHQKYTPEVISHYLRYVFYVVAAVDTAVSILTLLFAIQSANVVFFLIEKPCPGD